MRKIMIGGLLVLLMATPVLAQDIYNLFKEGYGFMSDTHMGAVGLLETIQPENPPIVFDYAGYEVTWALLDMEITSFVETGPVQAWTLAGGTIGIYEDAAFNLDYGTDPATGIATATDGTAALTGYVVDGSMLFNTLSETGTFLATVMFEGGTRFAEIEALGLQHHYWSVFDGVSSGAAVNVPEGYIVRAAGRIFNTEELPTESSSMSQLKALY